MDSKRNALELLLTDSKRNGLELLLTGSLHCNLGVF